MRGRRVVALSVVIAPLTLLALVMVFAPCARGQTGGSGIDISLDVESIEVVEGRKSNCWITLENHEDAFTYVDISFGGDYRLYAYVDSWKVPLGPKMLRQVNLTIYAPQGTVAPGTYHLEVIATPESSLMAPASHSVDVVVKELPGEGGINWLYLLIPFLLLIPLAVGIATYRVIKGMERTFKVFEVFLVHNDGRLIKHFPESDDKDEDVSISALFTAIQEFMNESFDYSGAEKEQGYLSEVVYGEIKVFIERGISFYIALVAKGTPPKDLRKRMAGLREGLEKRFEDVLLDWDGDLEPFEDLLGISLDQELEASFRAPVRKKDASAPSKKEGRSGPAGKGE